MKKIIVFGAGGNSLVILDIFLARVKMLGEDIEILGFLDDDVTKKELAGYPVLGGSDLASQFAADPDVYFVNGIGNNLTRKMVTEKYSDLSYCVAVHPTATIGSGVSLGEGCIIMPGAIINAGATIGKGALINTGAIVEHENTIGDYTHIASGVTTAGNVKVGELTMLGTGTKVIQGITIGRNVMIGAGSVVIRDIPNDCTAVGVPARIIKRQTK